MLSDFVHHRLSNCNQVRYFEFLLRIGIRLSGGESGDRRAGVDVVAGLPWSLSGLHVGVDRGNIVIDHGEAVLGAIGSVAPLHLVTLLDQLVLESLLRSNVVDSPLGLSDDFMADRAVVGSGSEGLLPINA